MSDIVGRLAKRAAVTEIIKDNPKIYYDAMYEIERLRAENETLRRDVKTAVMGDSAELQDVKRENEKLRKALNGLYKPVFENPVEVGSALDLALRAAAAAIRESGE